MTAPVVPDEQPWRAIAWFRLWSGGVVAIPTDTVYGLAASLSHEEAIEELFRIKGRPEDRAIVLLVDKVDQAESVGVFSPAARALAERFWPGPLTLVLPQAPEAKLPAVLTGGRSTIGVRLPDHPCPRFLAGILGPLPVTSANLSGGPDSTEVAVMMAQLAERLSLVLDGGPTQFGGPSTVVDCSGERPCILRAGVLEPARLAALLDEAGFGHAIGRT
jgi:L-threonylcarbamoyladenylate synthase